MKHHTFETNGVAANIAVIVVSKGRPERLKQLIPFLNAQTLTPSQLIIVVTEKSDADFDLDDLVDKNINAQLAYAKPGTSHQRNIGISLTLPSTDYVVFFDDDFIPSKFALEGIARGFAEFADVNGMSGHVLADGITGKGITLQEAESLIASADKKRSADVPPSIVAHTAGLYGCNMAMRLSAIEGLEFDERLPLYGWLEDIDFAARMSGEKIETDAFWGVHLGAREGREVNGEILGYSQIVNNYYIYKKGTGRGLRLFRLGLRNFITNHVKSLRSEPWIDRVARSRGNRIGLAHVFLGRANPENILHWRDR